MDVGFWGESRERAGVWCALLGRSGARFQLGQGKIESMLGTGHNLPQLWKLARTG